MDRVKGEHPLSEKQRVNVTLGKYGGNIIEICVAQINSRRARLVTRERERGYLSDGVEFPIRSKAFVQLFSPRWKESLIFLVGGEGRYQGEGTNRRLELSDTRYCETSPLMARPETALQDEREHEPENRQGLSTFASSRELAQLATRFRYLLRDLAIRNLDNRPIFNVSTCVCIFDVKQGSRGEIFRTGKIIFSFVPLYVPFFYEATTYYKHSSSNRYVILLRFIDFFLLVILLY